ncbi:MAG: dienelactone hydrolase family protein [Nitrospirales bacterium]
MSQHTTPYSLEQIGYGIVRFNSSGIFSTHKDHMVDPYAETRLPKEAQVEGIQYKPQAKGPFSSMVVLHDKWGLTSSIQDLAKRLACEGYVVIVPNLYGRQGGIVTANDEVADALRERLNQRQVLQDINACFEYLNANLAEDTTLEQLTRNAHAVVGFGMGGTLAIQTAAKRRRLQAAVAVNPEIPQDPVIINGLYCPLLLHVPEQTESLTQGELQQFQEECEKAGKTVTIQHYPGAADGFCNALSPVFRQIETDSVLQSSTEFINTILKKP